MSSCILFYTNIGDDEHHESHPKQETALPCPQCYHSLIFQKLWPIFLKIGDRIRARPTYYASLVEQTKGLRNLCVSQIEKVCLSCVERTENVTERQHTFIVAGCWELQQREVSTTH